MAFIVGNAFDKMVKTQEISNNLNPIWNAKQLNLPIDIPLDVIKENNNTQLDMDHPLLVQIYDVDPTAEDFLGQTIIYWGEAITKPSELLGGE